MNKNAKFVLLLCIVFSGYQNGFLDFAAGTADTLDMDAFEIPAISL